MRNVTRAAITFATVFPLLASTANATIFLQAGSGHPHLTSGAASWDSEWATGHAFDITDGRTITVVGSTARTWDIPIPITATGVNWTVVGHGVGSPLNVTNRICSFTSQGVFSACGASAVVMLDGGGSSVAFVPTNGTAYSQAFLPGGESAQLFHVRAF